MIKIEKVFHVIFIFVIAFALTNCDIIFSQSPYYSIKFSVAETGNINHNDEFVIDVTTCSFSYEPVVPSGDYWFGRDTSQLDWGSLPDSVLKTMSCKTSTVTSAAYESSNQAMVWENIYAIKIVRNSSDTMMIVFPVKLKSFVTFIDLGNIPFKPGIYDLTNEIVYSYGQWLKLEIPAGYNWLPGEKDKGILRSINLKK